MPVNPKDEFGVTHEQLLEIARAEVGPIEDPEELRRAFLAKFEAMSPLDQVAFKMRLGRRVNEEAKRTPGARYSPESWAILATVVLMLIFSAGAVFIALKTQLWIPLRIVSGLLAAIWLGVSIGGVRRLWHRARTGRDI